MSLPYGGFTTMLNPTQILSFAPRQHVRFGSEADMCAAKSDVRFAPNSDHESKHLPRHVRFPPESGRVRRN
jgi:hypothetical protein